MGDAGIVPPRPQPARAVRARYHHRGTTSSGKGLGTFFGQCGKLEQQVLMHSGKKGDSICFGSRGARVDTLQGSYSAIVVRMPDLESPLFSAKEALQHGLPVHFCPPMGLGEQYNVLLMRESRVFSLRVLKVIYTTSRNSLFRSSGQCEERAPCTCTWS